MLVVEASLLHVALKTCCVGTCVSTLRSTITSVRYGIQRETDAEDIGFKATSITVAGTSALFLSLALNQLRKHEDAFEGSCTTCDDLPLQPIRAPLS